MVKSSDMTSEEAYDAAMSEAEAVYLAEADEDDPYAMHKAVESLPIEILQQVIACKLSQ